MTVTFASRVKFHTSTTSFQDEKPKVFMNFAKSIIPKPDIVENHSVRITSDLQQYYIY